MTQFEFLTLQYEIIRSVFSIQYCIQYTDYRSAAAWRTEHSREATQCQWTRHEEQRRHGACDVADGDEGWSEGMHQVVVVVGGGGRVCRLQHGADCVAAEARGRRRSEDHASSSCSTFMAEYAIWVKR